MATVYLGLGSNIDAEKNLRFAIARLRSVFGDLTLSPVYASAALGFNGPDFLNLVVAVVTDAGPLEIIEQTERIHELAETRSIRSRRCDCRVATSSSTASYSVRLPTSRRISCTRSPGERSRNIGANSMSIVIR